MVPDEQATIPDTTVGTTPPPGDGAVQPPKKRKKRKYSKGLKELQQLERTVSKTSNRVARAVAKGMATYRKRSNKSAVKKRDGSLRDFAVNIAGGLGKTLRVLSGVPADLAKGLNTKGARKRTRRQVKIASRIVRPRY